MSDLTLFGPALTHLGLTHTEAAELLSDATGEIHRPRFVKLVAEGKLPVPAFAWSPLRAYSRLLERQSDMAVQLHTESGESRFTVSKADLQNRSMRPILVRAALKLPGGTPVEVVQRDSYDGETWGIL